MQSINSVSISLSLFELDKLLSLIEEKEALREGDEVICHKIHAKLEDVLLDIILEKEDDIFKILKSQKEEYIKK